MDVRAFFQLTAEVIGVLTAVTGAAWGSWLCMRRAFRHLDFVSEKLRVLDSLAAELKPNGGGSLRDAINRIELSVHQLAGWQKGFKHIAEFPLWESDASGACVYANEALCEITGCTEDEMKASGWVRNLHKDDESAVLKSWARSVADGSVFNLCYRFVHGGYTYRVNGYARQIISPNGVVLGWMGTLRLLSKEKEN